MSKFDFDEYDFEPPDEALVHMIDVLEEGDLLFSDLDFDVNGHQWKRGEFTVEMTLSWRPGAISEGEDE